MTANVGRTHAKHITCKIDNSGGTLTDISAYVNQIGTVGLNFDAPDTTAYSDGVKNVVIGQPEAPLRYSDARAGDCYQWGCDAAVPGHTDRHPARVGVWRAAVWHLLIGHVRLSNDRIHRECGSNDLERATQRLWSYRPCLGHSRRVII